MNLRDLPMLLAQGQQQGTGGAFQIPEDVPLKLKKEYKVYLQEDPELNTKSFDDWAKEKYPELYGQTI